MTQGARSASVCGYCGGGIAKDDPVRCTSWSWPRDLHERCAAKDTELAEADDAAGTVGVVTG